MSTATQKPKTQRDVTAQFLDDFLERLRPDLVVGAEERIRAYVQGDGALTPPFLARKVLDWFETEQGSRLLKPGVAEVSGIPTTLPRQGDNRPSTFRVEWRTPGTPLEWVTSKFPFKPGAAQKVADLLQIELGRMTRPQMALEVLQRAGLGDRKGTLGEHLLDAYQPPPKPVNTLLRQVLSRRFADLSPVVRETIVQEMGDELMRARPHEMVQRVAWIMGTAVADRFGAPRLDRGDPRRNESSTDWRDWEPEKPARDPNARSLVVG